MDDILSSPVGLFDYVQDRLAAARRQAASRGRRRRKGDDPHADPDADFLLVQKDRLFVRVAPMPGPRQVEVTADQAAAMAHTFGEAFRAVWAAIPAADRRCMLDYWRGPRPFPWDLNLGPPPRHIPVIQILLDPGPGPLTAAVCAELGFELTFPDALIVDEPDRLPGEIVRVLLQTHRYASGRHWELNWDMIEEPLEQWEQEQGGDASDEARDRKRDGLEEAFLRVHHAEVAELLTRWQSAVLQAPAGGRSAGGQLGNEA
jgi:hypothetical protein